MLATFKPWTKVALKAHLADVHTNGAKLPAQNILMETSMFGAEIKPRVTVAVCLDHPKRTKFAQVEIDADLNIVKVK